MELSISNFDALPISVLPLSSGREDRSEIAMDPDRGKTVGKFFLHDVLGEEFCQCAALGTALEGFEVALSDGEVVGRCDRHDFIPDFESVVQQAIDGSNVHLVTHLRYVSPYC